MAVTKEQVIDYLSGMTVMEMADLVKELEGKWGVEAAPAVVAGAAAPAAAAEAAEEQTEFDVIIKDVGAKKINVIKSIRELTSMGLKEAKDMAAVGAVVKSGISKSEADEVAKKLEAAGAKVEIK
jgi:large subunit ribosomal protein L7/L12